MIDKLTEDQEALMPVVAKEWIDLCLNSGLQPTEEELREGINWIYSLAKEKPPKKITVCKNYTDWILTIYNSKSKGSSVRSSVWSSVKSSVWSSVRSSVRSSVGLGYDSDWFSFYDYFARIGILKNKEFDKLISLFKKGIWDGVYLKDEAIICTMPTKVCKDNQNRLHSLTEPAVQWADGKNNLYFIEGIAFPETIWKKLYEKELTPEEAIALSNIEQRTIALRIIGYEIVLQKLGAKTLDIHTERITRGSAWDWVLSLKNLNYERKLEYALYEINLHDHDKPARFVKVSWFTREGIQKDTLIRVSPECNTAMQAIGWTFGEEEYTNEVES